MIKACINDENALDKSMSDQYDVGKCISVIYRKFQVEMNKRLKPYGVNSSQYIFLIQLYKNNNVSQEFLSNKLLIDKSATARAIAQLEQAGFVERKVSEDDKRCKIVSLTEKSHEVQKELWRFLKDWNKELIKTFSEDEYQQVHGSLMQMMENVLSSDMNE
ncbi:MAG: MarR family winged helix-turn-helix transcriptional regulator [Lachnospiraceae bacterium]